MKYYELWDGETGNLVASCRTETEALALVRATIAAHGPKAVEPWGLLWDDDGATEVGSGFLPKVTMQWPRETAGGLIAEGRALAELALTRSAAAT